MSYINVKVSYRTKVSSEDRMNVFVLLIKRNLVVEVESVHYYPSSLDRFRRVFQSKVLDDSIGHRQNAPSTNPCRISNISTSVDPSASRLSLSDRLSYTSDICMNNLRCDRSEYHGWPWRCLLLWPKKESVATDCQETSCFFSDIFTSLRHIRVAFCSWSISSSGRVTCSPRDLVSVAR